LHLYYWSQNTEKEIKNVPTLFIRVKTLSLPNKSATMDKTTKDKVEYTIAFISDFAKTHSLSTMQAYRYLERFKGLEFIDKFYGVLHTFSFEDAIDDLTAYCHRKGGALV
jgi:hypothetical protein